MLKRLSMGLLVGTLGLGTGCSSDSHGGGDVIDQPDGFPFVLQAVAASDLCDDLPANTCALAEDPPRGATTATLSQPAAGKLCLKGAVAPRGYAFLVLVFTRYDARFNPDITKVLKKFDADELGITQVAFTIDSPPSGGVTVGAAVLKTFECPTGGRDCRTGGFSLMTDPLSNVPLNITTSGPHVAPFANFEHADPALTFNASALDAFTFLVGAGDYDFCIHDFKFLDAAGEEVKP